MAFTARLQPKVEGEAKRYAESLGISLNALLSVALRDYLDARQHPATLKSAGPSVPAPSVPVSSAAVSSGPFKAPKSPRAPCPCGSRQQWRHCHGKGGWRDAPARDVVSDAALDALSAWRDADGEDGA